MNFGKFEILADLGQGAMGKVYRAHDPILDRPVALKTVAPSLLEGKDTLARFRREARAAARLQHPNIVTIFEVGEVEGTHYIAMELVEGIDLGEAMTPTRPLPARAEGAHGGGRVPRVALRPPHGRRAPRRQAGQHPAHAPTGR